MVQNALKLLFGATLSVAFFSVCSCSNDSGTNANQYVHLDDYTDLVADSIEFIETDSYKVLLPTEEVLKMVGASRAKLVFRDEIQKKMIYAQYSRDDSSEVRFFDLNSGINAYHAEISPDGEWVAFGTTYEGLPYSSTLYVQNLRTGRLVALRKQAAVVPRWSVIEQDTVIFFMENAVINNVDGWRDYGNYYVRFSDGKFSKPQKNFGKGSFNVVSNDFRFAASIGPKLYARKMTTVNGKETYVDTLWFGGDQVCNVSLANDSSLRISFLDMTGKEGVEYVGEKYLPHTRLLVMDSLGTIIQAVPSPENTAFDQTEWIAGAEFEVCTLQDFFKDLIHDKIALVNMKDETVTEIISGEDMWHPDFWIEK